jgi:hypothetical protein
MLISLQNFLQSCFSLKNSTFSNSTFIHSFFFLLLNIFFFSDPYTLISSFWYHILLAYSYMLCCVFCGSLAFIIKLRSFICWFRDTQHLFSYGNNYCFTSLPQFLYIVRVSKCNMILLFFYLLPVLFRHFRRCQYKYILFAGSNASYLLNI